MLCVLGLLASWPLASGLAQDALARAFDFERQGRWADAAAAFRSVLAREPSHAPALLGAERVYTQLGLRDSIMMLVRRALQVDSTSSVIRQVELRTARALGGEPLAAEALRRWMAAVPRSEAPHRELVRALLAGGRLDEARTALLNARNHLGPAVLRPEMAQLEAQAGNWSRAAEEWRAAVAATPTMMTAALFNLQAAPPPQRDGLLRSLTTPDTSQLGRRMGAELLLGWRDAPRAWTMLSRALPAEGPLRETTLRGFADRARSQPGRESQRVAGEALELLAASASGPAAARLRIESARAFWAAGEGAAARRVLRAIADDPGSPADVATSSVATLIEMHVREGDVAAAAALLEQRRRRLPAGEGMRLGLIVARGWLARGELDRAEAAALADSSLAGDEIRGWAALYRGHVAAARELLRGSGLRSGQDAPAERAAVVALLQAVEADTVPALGAALLTAGRGDTAAAARALAALARSGGPAAGTDQARAALLALAAGFAQAAGDTTGADTLYRAIIERLPDTSPAPAAMLAVARLMGARGDVRGAVTQLETMILRYPQSALLPEARRELDRVRGLVPRS
jgi:tetratricopeptide (TPR) repeat protein